MHTEWKALICPSARRLVSHAVGAAMRDLLGDWYLMVTQLEHQLLLGKLTLQVGVLHRQALSC